MNPRQEKKLSKRICQILPHVFRYAWVDDERMESSWIRGVSTSHCLCIGGEPDYWGEASESYTCWKIWVDNWQFFIDCDGAQVIVDDVDWNRDIPQFRMQPKTRYLISLAKRVAAHHEANKE